MTWAHWTDGELAKVREAGRWRQVRPLDARGPEATVDGRAVIAFASNDYLGLTMHPTVIAAAHEALDRWGSGAGSARLIVGSRPIHHDLEQAIAEWRRCDRALLFPTGYAANLGVLSALGGPDVTVMSDELNHASIIDGCRLSRSRVVVYPHSDLDACASALAASSGRRIVVTDTVFSMDGDVARVDELAGLCVAHDALLIVDEAHAVLGPEMPAGLEGLALLRVGTMSKTLGALGGFVAGATDLIDLIVNRSRPFIFTTAPTPADTAAALAALAICRSDQGDALRQRLRAHIGRVRAGHPSPIVPVVLGDELAAVAAAASLLQQGLLVPAIRPPTVPAGTSRLRVALSAAHSDAMVDRLVAALALLDPASAQLRGP
ncbi:MAG TPA: 8-amino-7-oxononanoate synthase [Acidimicrobiales bacterium]|nr:8-amino-7-oxononanoate synthase [Acidimicrobiales bacterium]